ncbi:MAG: hypothetical protein WBP96_02590, partial [Nitrososphaeraceae archaeon]
SENLKFEEYYHGLSGNSPLLLSFNNSISPYSNLLQQVPICQNLDKWRNTSHNEIGSDRSDLFS